MAVKGQFTQGEFKRGVAPLFNILPPHARNIYPYYGEGDKGGEVAPVIFPSGLKPLRAEPSGVDR